MSGATYVVTTQGVDATGKNNIVEVPATLNGLTMTVYFAIPESLGRSHAMV